MTEEQEAQSAAMQLVIANLRGVICELAGELIAAKGGTQGAMEETLNLIQASAQKAHDNSNQAPNALALVIKLTQILLRDTEQSIRARGGSKTSRQ